MFIAVAGIGWTTIEKVGISFVSVAVICMVIITTVTLQTHLRAHEWSSKEQLVLTALENQPQSVRAKMDFTEILAANGKLEELLLHLNSSILQHPEKGVFFVQRLMFTGATGRSDSVVYDEALSVLSDAPIGTPDALALIELFNFRSANRFEWPTLEEVELLFAAAMNGRKRLRAESVSVFHGVHADLLAKLNRLKEAEKSIRLSIAVRPNDIEPKLRLVKILAMNGRELDALDLLGELKTAVESDTRSVIDVMEKQLHAELGY